MFEKHKKLLVAIAMLVSAIAGYTANVYDDKAAEILNKLVAEDAIPAE